MTSKALSLVISDDGKGFDTCNMDLEGHYGRQIMQERAGEIHAELQITSQVDQGTQVSIWLPLKVAVQRSSIAALEVKLPLKLVITGTN